MKLSVATCQFPVSSDIRGNARHVLRQMEIAKQRGARVAHFCEAALSGYAGAEFESYAGFDWDQLTACTQQVLDRARELRLWVILGSTHRLTGRHKPHNSVYVIDDAGRLVDRYDKRFCAGNRAGTKGDLAHYSPGNHFSVFTVHGISCGVLICHDYRYPELYREYKRRGVQLLFHSFHAGHVTPRILRAMRSDVGARFRRWNGGSTLPGITMPATAQSSAANNFMWISCSNTSARESCWPSFFVRPDGVTTGRLRINTAGVLISIVDTNQDLYDSTVAWRDRAMRQVFHSGRLVNDRRSKERTQL
ncbi:MAG: carbon-nitrogen hydrolase family protein [Deltaproteobacteria bacterium]|nr:MAG: carbon-nitrogen hydrolase family protein [Deltaproteobacteria bacterium]